MTAGGSVGLVITLLVATGNKHKVEEIRAGLGAGFVVLSTREVGVLLSPEETGSTFAENAAIKSIAWAGALASSGSSGIEWVLADDSGLEVDALGGAPGVQSARFAALDDGRPGNSPDGENNAKLLRLLEGVPVERRTARFRCVLALTPVLPAPVEVLREATRWFDGRCEGRIQMAEAGRGGFGYDPLFVPEGFRQSFAELGEEVKQRISHRAKALEALKAESAWQASARVNLGTGG
jgi:XTP/dITP diphosphohydrolase